MGQKAKDPKGNLGYLPDSVLRGLSETLMEMMDDAVNAPEKLNRSLGYKMKLLSPAETVIFQNFLGETFDIQVAFLQDSIDKKK